MQRYWFKRKMYGWGWTPATWEGWVVTLGFIVVVLLLGAYVAITEDLSVYFGGLIFSIFLLLRICFEKGEKPRWQWGKSKK